MKGAFRFFIVLPYHMATAAYIFLNDNFLPLGYCFPSHKTKIVQLWHGAGAFKKFGLSTEDSEKVESCDTGKFQNYTSFCYLKAGGALLSRHLVFRRAVFLQKAFR